MATLTPENLDTVHPLHGTAVGHLMLVADEAPLPCPEDCAAVDLRPIADQLDAVQQNGSLLGLRLLVPLVPAPAAELQQMEVICAGADADFMAHCARQIGLDQAQVTTSSTANAEGDNVGGNVHRAFFGCSGEVPAVADLLPILGQLRPDGHLGLYGLPTSQLGLVQQTLSECSFSMRSGGVDGKFAFLSGSLDSLKLLRGKGALV